MLNTQLKCTIIINNYNYASFINQAIDSALKQTCKPHEVIVVDDGSTDDSLKIIRQYGNQVNLITKQNGGQASAFNAGFNASTGNWIWFLDADDWLRNDAIETIAECINSDISKIHGPLQAVNGKGSLLNFIVPSMPLSEGDVIPEIMQYGGYRWPPTSGNLFPRWVLHKCMPVPEEEYRLCSDLYVCSYAAMLGKVHAIKKPIGYYRIHATNNFHGFKLEPVWLDSQAKNILTAASLTEMLVAKHIYKESFHSQFGRRSLELLMTAKRFSKSDLLLHISKKSLQKRWWNTEEVKKLSGFAKCKGVIFWIVLCNAPLILVKYFIQMQQKSLNQK